MLQLDVPRCRIGNNLGGVVDSERTYHTPQAHLSALVTRQASKVRRYKNGCSVGVYLRRWSELVSDVERFVPDRVHVARTNNKQVRLWRISAFLTLSSLKGTKRRFFMMITPIHTVEEGLQRAFEALGKDAQVAAIPEGPLVLGLLKH